MSNNNSEPQVTAEMVQSAVEAVVLKHLPDSDSVRSCITAAVGEVIAKEEILKVLPDAVKTATEKVLANAKEESATAKKESAKTEDLGTVRDAATGWLGIVGTAAGLFGFASLIFGGGAVANLNGLGKGAVLVLFAAAVICVGLSMGLGAVGSHGWPRTMKVEGVRMLRRSDDEASVGIKLAKAVFRLRASVYLAGVALGLLLLAALTTAGLS